MSEVDQTGNLAVVLAQVAEHVANTPHVYHDDLDPRDSVLNVDVKEVLVFAHCRLYGLDTNEVEKLLDV